MIVISISGVDEVHMALDCFHAFFTLRLFVCCQSRDLKRLLPVVISQVFYSAPIIRDHCDIKCISHRAIAKKEIPILTAKLLNFRPVTAKLKAIGGVDVVVVSVLGDPFQQCARFDLFAWSLCRYKNAVTEDEDEQY